ncbi:MAG: hypothetical protein Q8K82_11625 [Gemmatimonadaceae bacterium]|nr:hypothetical protein [Gemmatimonadaceae bacterium]
MQHKRAEDRLALCTAQRARRSVLSYSAVERRASVVEAASIVDEMVRSGPVPVNGWAAPAAASDSARAVNGAE